MTALSPARVVLGRVGSLPRGPVPREGRRRLQPALGLSKEPGSDFNVIHAAVSAAIALLKEAIRLYVSPANPPN